MEKMTLIDFYFGAVEFSKGFRQKGFEIIKDYLNTTSFTPFV